jgi:hypothetical protein
MAGLRRAPRATGGTRAGCGLAVPIGVGGLGWTAATTRTPASLKLGVKARDLTAALPKFHVIAIDELLGEFFRGPIVGT